ncbi:DNA-3-methyladenine glycosylase [Cesiribacter sp. SM1]|uniref:DNA-3-methyladenine glycosylase family protein n=1 Tax=Cesiribacter sp. SM1 TaxID=2861196 RepID=UPI001CD2D84D|nr:DNA glycosylase [Cesiribacter sp. SM1]
MQKDTSSIQLSAPEIFSFSECLWYLDRNYDESTYQLEGNGIVKLLQLNNSSVLIRISSENKHLQVEALQPAVLSAMEWQTVQAYVAEWFDLARNIAPFYGLLQKSPDYAFLARQYRGLRLMGIPDLFECLCWSIIGQQINLSFAYRLKRRLVEACGSGISWNGTVYYAFPAPAQLLQLSMEKLQSFQLSRSKAAYLLEVSRLFDAGEISKTALAGLEPEQMFKRLTAIRGVGEWTANYTLMKSMKVQSSVPYGDAGLQNAWKKIHNLAAKPSREELVKGLEPYRGWEAYLVFYLWRSLS